MQNDNMHVIKENKYKILRTSLILGQGVDRESTIIDFEDAAKEIDKMNNEIYLAEIDKKMYETHTLEEEQKKLEELTNYIAGRVSQRESLIQDYLNVTGNILEGLDEIKYSKALYDYQDRLKNINDYLNNNEKLTQLKEELNNLEENLEKEKKQKNLNEIKNADLEKQLQRKFVECVTTKIDVNKYNEDNIASALIDIENEAKDREKSLEIFQKSFATLKNAGINEEDEKEYKSYVEGAIESYYESKEEEYVLTIYNMLLIQETEFNKIHDKRERIQSILDGRKELREKLDVKSEDILSRFYSTFNEQKNIIDSQNENITSIQSLTDKINYNNNRLVELEEDNQKVEILAILKEYGIIDTYEEEFKEEEKIEEPSIEIPVFDNDKELEPEINASDDNNDILEEEPIEITSLPNIDENVENTDIKVEENTVEEIDTDNIVEASNKEEMQNTTDEESEKEELETKLEIDKTYKSNFVMGAHNPIGLNADECVEKSLNVMKRVAKMLKIDLPEKKQEEQPEENLVVEKAEDNNFFEDEEKESISEPTSEVEENKVINPLVNEVEESASNQSTESKVSSVLPETNDFWGETNITSNDEDSQDIGTSNDDFFANNMDDFEFPDLDEFK